MTNIMTVPRELGTLNINDWAAQFNLYRETNSLPDAAVLIWNDWNVPENPFIQILPNPESLIFSLLTYIPDRTLDVDIINSVPFIITWDSPPIYDTMSNAWNNVDAWTCSDWKTWHIALEQHYGDTYKANAVFESAWMHSDNQCYFLSVMLCPDTDYCRYDCAFVEYLASKDVEIGNLVSNVVCDLSSVVKNIVETADNITTGVANTTKTVSTIMPWVAGGLILYGGSKIVEKI